MIQLKLESARRVKTFFDFDASKAELKKRPKRSAEAKITLPGVSGTGEKDKDGNPVYNPIDRAEVSTFFGDKLVLWALEGYGKFLKQRINAALASGLTYDGLSKEEKKQRKSLMRQFNTSFRSFVTDMDLEKAKVLDTLLSRKTYAEIADGIRELLNQPKDEQGNPIPVSLDYTTEFPTPSWFPNPAKLIDSLGEEDDEEEETEEKTE